MKSMKKAGIVGLMLAAVGLVVSCAGNTAWVQYREGLQKGYTNLQYREYQPAIQQLLSASQGDPTQAIPLALAGQAAYQMGNYSQASQYLAQAESLVKGPDAAYIIIKGYQALIAFRENRQQDGMAALGEYLRVYYFNNPDSTYYDLDRMYKSGNIVFPTAEGWINNQLSRYEGQLQQWGWTWR